MTFKPMLAATVVDRTKLKFPFLASPKLDGIRCIVLNGEVLSRSLKPIRNKFIVSKLQHLPDMDGELIVGSATAGDVFNRTTRGVMSAEGSPSFLFHAFDTLQDLLSPFHERLSKVGVHEFVMPVKHTPLNDLNDLGKYEEQMLEQGYEGVMLRGINNQYKCGRATATENSLWKLKQFTDGELRITALREGIINNNLPTFDALGGTTRSMHKENMVPNGKVGTIVGVDLATGQNLEISPGKMTHIERLRYWNHPLQLIGKIARYKCFAYGSIVAPRFATFQSLRDIEDMS